MEPTIPKHIATDTPISSSPLPPAPRIGKFAASGLLVSQSWGILKQDKEMMLFPVISLLVSLAVIVAAGSFYFFSQLGGSIDALEKAMDAQQASGGDYALLFVVYFVSFFITIFFQTGIVTIAHARMEGRDLSFGDGMRNAFAHAGKIALWSLLAATVGVVLRAVADRSKWIGKLVTVLLGAAWSIATYFIVPILLLEDASVKDSLKLSVETIKRTWGETIIVGVGMGFFFMMLALLGVVVFVAIAVLFIGNLFVALAAVIALVVYLLLLSVVSSTLDVIYRVALYEYAKTGTVPGGFTRQAIDLAFTKK